MNSTRPLSTTVELVILKTASGSSRQQPAGHDELQVMALVRVDLPPAAGGVGQVGISRARMTCRR